MNEEAMNYFFPGKKLYFEPRINNFDSSTAKINFRRVTLLYQRVKSEYTLKQYILGSSMIFQRLIKNC
ncbi:hypothetical protein LCDVSa169R [Lymphocystis disease virus 3]|uniref:Uncharacterized protein n=1 Tax=Lymphocystis disease virus 3 TaxID=2560566 RepID=A0A1B2RW76_9VIRU|nr:hypothetical protein BZK12_gp169 [Lymphocystis disease virus Sa]AOC55253.1 hypothetical protein LCDVSa169R [Lymphocystis disease virus 3]